MGRVGGAPSLLRFMAIYIGALCTTSLIFLFLTIASPSPSPSPSFSPSTSIISNTITPELVELYKEEVRGMYSHALGSYMDFAFPDDELKPLSCSGRSRKTSNR